MKFKKNDLIVLTDYGVNNFFTKNDPQIKIWKRKLFRVKAQMNERNVYLESTNENVFTSSFPVECFRLATPLEIKLYNVKEIFN